MCDFVLTSSSSRLCSERRLISMCWECSPATRACLLTGRRKDESLLEKKSLSLTLTDSELPFIHLSARQCVGACSHICCRA